MFVFGVILVRIQSECAEIHARITPNTDTFEAVVAVLYSFLNLMELVHADVDILFEFRFRFCFKSDNN